MLLTIDDVEGRYADRLLLYRNSRVLRAQNDRTEMVPLSCMRWVVPGFRDGGAEDGQEKADGTSLFATAKIVKIR